MGGRGASLRKKEGGGSIRPNAIGAYPGEDLSKWKTLSGLNPKRISNKYITMNRVSKDGEKVVVKVSDSHLKMTPYGYALLLDNNHVVYLKNFNVSSSYYGNEVMLNKKYFNVKEKSYTNDLADDPKKLSFSGWKKIAKEQQKAGTKVQWENHYRTIKQKAILKNMAKKYM